MKHIDPIYIGFGVNFLLTCLQQWLQRRRKNE